MLSHYIKVVDCSNVTCLIFSYINMVIFLPFGCGQHTGFFSPHLLEYITQGDCAIKNSQKVNYKLVWSSYVSIVLRDCRLHWSVYAHTCTLTLFIYLLLAINQSYKMIWWTKNASSLAKVFWSLALLKNPWHFILSEVGFFPLDFD